MLKDGNKRRKFNRALKVGKSQYCGSTIYSRLRYPDAKKRCCDVQDAGDEPDCDAAGWPKGQGFNVMLKYTRDGSKFFEHFHKVWKRATSANSMTAVYQLADGKANWGLSSIDWSKNNVTFSN